MGEKSSRGCDYHIGSKLKALLLTGKLLAVGAAVYCHAAYREVVGESFELTVDLLCELVGRHHDYAVYGIVGEVAFGQSVYYRQQVGGGFSGSCLGNGYKVASFKDYAYGFFLDWSTLLKLHCIKRIEHIVA